MSSDGSWCTIESDPGVFTELIETIGVSGVQVEELYSMDEHSFAQLHPVYGLIFLFKWRQETDNRPTLDAMDQPELFFANQVIPNACATQAILSVLLNLGEKVELGPTLSEFLAFTREFPPDIKGLAIGNSDIIRQTHNSFSRQDPFEHEKADDSDKEKEAFHFVAYIPHHGKVYELDGLKKGPILLGEGEDWLKVAAPAIQDRIARYASSEIRFNLLALVRNLKLSAQEGLARHEKRLRAVEAAISAGGDGSSVPMDDTGDDFGLAHTVEELEQQRAAEREAMDDCRRTIREEEEKFARWRAENVRRKHNYIPFAVNLLRILAEKNQLKPLMDKAKRRQEQAVAAARKQKEKSQPALSTV